MKENKFVLLKDVIIKAGTVLGVAPKQRGGKHNVESIVAMGKDSTAYFNCSLLAIKDMPKNLIIEVSIGLPYCNHKFIKTEEKLFLCKKCGEQRIKKEFN